jgi:hypothetical protein
MQKSTPSLWADAQARQAKLREIGAQAPVSVRRVRANRIDAV